MCPAQPNSWIYRLMSPWGKLERTQGSRRESHCSLRYSNRALSRPGQEDLATRAKFLARLTKIINDLIKCVQNSNCSRRAPTQWQLRRPTMHRTPRDLSTQGTRIATPERLRKSLRSRSVQQQAPFSTSLQGHNSNIKTLKAATQLSSCRKS